MTIFDSGEYAAATCKHGVIADTCGKCEEDYTGGPGGSGFRSFTVPGRYQEALCVTRCADCEYAGIGQAAYGEDVCLLSGKSIPTYVEIPSSCPIYTGEEDPYKDIRNSLEHYQVETEIDGVYEQFCC